MTDLSDDVLRAIKQRFGPVFAVSVGGRRFICRTVTRYEAAIIGYLDSDELKPEQMDDLFRLAVLFPEDAADDETIDVGSVRYVVDAVLDKSGLATVSGMQAQLEAARKRKTVYDDIAAIICAAFPKYAPDELNAWPISRLMDVLIVAEATLVIKGLANKGLMNPVDFTPTDEQGRPVGGHGMVEVEDELARSLYEGAQRVAQQYS